MNIFYEYGGIFGKAETAHLNRTMEEFLQLSSTIRGKLGKQAYLLDKYISMILEGTNATLVQEAAEQGFAMSGELRRLCHSVMDGTEDDKEHPLYEKAREYICSHPLPYQEQATKLDLYHIALFSDLMEYATKQYHDRQKEKQRAVYDIVYLRDLYRKIGTIIEDEGLMEQLNLLLRQRFLIVTPMVAFLQGMTNDLLYSLTSQDIETNHYSFQLLK